MPRTEIMQMGVYFEHDTCDNSLQYINTPLSPRNPLLLPLLLPALTTNVMTQNSASMSVKRQQA